MNDLNLLKVLNLLMVTHSVTLTAKNMNVSAGAISHALNRLRREFADPLFIRRGNTLIPTKLALTLSPQIEEIINKAEQVYNGRRENLHSNQFGSTIRIRCHDTMELALVLPIQKYISDMNIVLDVSSNYFGMHDLNILELHQRKFDVLLGTQPISDRSFTSNHLVTIGQCLVCRSGHPRILGQISETQLHKEQFTSNLSLSELSCNLQSSNIVISHATPHLLSRYSLVATSDYLSFSSLYIAEYFRRILPIQIVGYDLGIAPVNVYMTYHNSLKNDPAINFVLNALKKYISDYQGALT